MLQKKPAFFGQPVENTDEWNADARKEDAVASALAASGLVDATEVKVAVVGSEARLMGDVALEEEITTAGTIALEVEGIDRVRNVLRVKDKQLNAEGESRSL